eukprot:53350_1
MDGQRGIKGNRKGRSIMRYMWNMKGNVWILDVLEVKKSRMLLLASLVLLFYVGKVAGFVDFLNEEGECVDFRCAGGKEEQDATFGVVGIVVLRGKSGWIC